MSDLSLFSLLVVTLSVVAFAVWLDARMRRMKRAEHRARLVAAFDRVQASLVRAAVHSGAAAVHSGAAQQGLQKAADAMESASARAEGRLH
jgi:hypothetical protein